MLTMFRIKKGGKAFRELSPEARPSATPHEPGPRWVLVDSNGHIHRLGGDPPTLATITLIWYDFHVPDRETRNQGYTKDHFRETHTCYYCRECGERPRLEFLGTDEEKREYFRERFWVDDVEVDKAEFDKQVEAENREEIEAESERRNKRCESTGEARTKRAKRRP